MKKLYYYLIIIFVQFSCHSGISDTKNSESFEKSYKEEKGEGLTEYLDTITNIYSNFRYHVAFDAPNNWKTDAGVSEHTIFRAYQADSSITFSINIIELKSDKNNKKPIDVWEFYQSNKQQMDYPFTTFIEEQLKTKVNDYKCVQSYIKNKSCLKRKFNYDFKELDNTYNITVITYQTFIDGLTYTFTLNIPTVFYQEKSAYYDAFFRDVYFLADGERLDEILRNSK